MFSYLHKTLTEKPVLTPRELWAMDIGMLLVTGALALLVSALSG